MKASFKASLIRAEQAIDFVAGDINNGIQRIAATFERVETAFDTTDVAEAADPPVRPVINTSTTSQAMLATVDRLHATRGRRASLIGQSLGARHGLPLRASPELTFYDEERDRAGRRRPSMTVSSAPFKQHGPGKRWRTRGGKAPAGGSPQ